MASHRIPLSARSIQPLGSRSQKPKPQKKSRFKHYDIAQIVSDCNAIFSTTSSSLAIHENDLTNPTPERVQQIYLAILHTSFEDITADSFKQRGFSSHVVEHPELLEEATYRIQFVRVMKHLMSTCKVDDFGLDDLYDPSSKRTCRNLSCLLNFIKFVWNVYNEPTVSVLKEELEKKKGEYIEQYHDNEKLSQDIKSLEKQKEEEQELVQDLQKAIAHSQQENHEAKIQYEAAVHHQQTVSDFLETKTQKLETLQKELKERLQSIEYLQKQVVTSPEKLKATLSQLEKQVKDAKVKKNETESLLLMWESLVSNAHQVAPVIDMLNEDLTMLLTKADKKSQLQSSLSSIEEQIGRQKQMLRESSAEHLTLLRHIKLVEDEANTTQYNGHVNHEATDSLQRDVCLLQQELKAREMKDSELCKEADKVAAEIIAVEERLSKALQEIAENTTKIRNHLEKRAREYLKLVEPRSTLNRDQ